MPFRKVLIAIDREPVAAHAADAGIDLARALGADIAFVTIIDSPLAHSEDAGFSQHELLALARRDAKMMIESFRKQIPKKLAVDEFILTGNPATEIVKVAQKWSADVIVIGSHGRGGVPRALLGSVAEDVMRHAPCPVLVIRAKG